MKKKITLIASENVKYEVFWDGEHYLIVQTDKNYKLIHNDVVTYSGTYKECMSMLHYFVTYES